MKKQLLLLAALSLSVFGAKAQGTWTPQATGFPNISTGVFNVSVVDADTVWISSYDGSGGMANVRDYSTTIDGGATWIPGEVSAPAGHAWSMIQGINASTAWAVMYDAVVGSGGGIWKTVDGGVTWNQQGVGVIFNGTSFPDVVHFWNANEGFAMGDPNPTKFELYTTVDGGTTWTPVPAVNIPASLTGEYGIVNHYSVVGNTVWFDTNKGRVFKSIDKGLTWTVATTGITVPANGAIDVVFWNATDGIARLYNNTTGVNTTLKSTTDGGVTWSTFTATGNFFGSDVAYVPGTTSRLVSTGAATGFIGSSYSDDAGFTWIDIETGAQRTALGIFDANTMWSGGFTTSPTTDGIYKYAPLAVIACGDASIASGTMSAPDVTICFGDTLFITTSNAVAPTAGGTFGFSVIVSTTDISNNSDPLNQPPGVILGGTGVLFPVASSINTTLINVGTPFPDGVYYFTPLVYANASGTGNISGLTLDPSCTYTGTSLMVTLYAAGDPNCAVGLNDLVNNGFGLSTYQSSNNEMNMTISSAKQTGVSVNVFDLTGRIVISKDITVSQGKTSQVLDITNLSSGTYIIKINDGSNTATSKLVRY